MRRWIDRSNRKKKGYDNKWNILWIWELEEIQPYLTKGANFWTTLQKIFANTPYEFNIILNELQLETNATYTEGFLYEYESKIFFELTKDKKYLIGTKFETAGI